MYCSEPQRKRFNADVICTTLALLLLARVSRCVAVLASCTDCGTQTLPYHSVGATTIWSPAFQPTLRSKVNAVPPAGACAFRRVQGTTGAAPNNCSLPPPLTRMPRVPMLLATAEATLSSDVKVIVARPVNGVVKEPARKTPVFRTRMVAAFNSAVTPGRNESSPSMVKSPSAGVFSSSTIFMLDGTSTAAPATGFLPPQVARSDHSSTF